MNEHKPDWKCPVCLKSIKYEDLRYDLYFFSILKEISNFPDIIQVTIQPDGKMKPIGQKIMPPYKSSCELLGMGANGNWIINPFHVMTDDQPYYTTNQNGFTTFGNTDTSPDLKYHKESGIAPTDVEVRVSSLPVIIIIPE